jgi:hypothetical protein
VLLNYNFVDYFGVEDEILCDIAEELGKIVPFVGGQEHYKYVIGPLERLCGVEEILVAEKVFFLFILLFVCLF